MDKPEQQERVKEILRDICPIVKKGGDVECMGCIRGRTPCEPKCRWKNIFEAKQQLESFYKEKYLGGLIEKIEKEIKKYEFENESSFSAGWNKKSGLKKALSIIQEMKEARK